MAPMKSKAATTIVPTRQAAGRAQKKVATEVPAQVDDEPVSQTGKSRSRKAAASSGKFIERVQKSILAKRPAAVEDEVEEDEEIEKEDVPASSDILKRPAAAAESADPPVADKTKGLAKKAVGTFAKGVQKKIIAKRPANAGGEHEYEDDGCETEKVPVTKKPMKRPAAAAADEAVAKKGKKDSATVTEESLVSERTAELKAMSAIDLKELAKSKGLEVGLKSEMLQSVLTCEANAREEARAREAKVKGIETEIKNGFVSKGMPELKELCEKEGLKKGGSKDELVARLVEEAKGKGQIDRCLKAQLMNERRQELLAMDKDNLCKLCSNAGVDILVKDVMVERLLVAEMLSN